MERQATAGQRPGRRRVGVAVVRGDSMRPTLQPGDRVLVRYAAAVRPGQIVVARFPDDTVVIKRASEERAAGWWLVSDNADEGFDSRHRGAIAPADVLGVVRLRLWPRPRAL